MLPIRKLLKRLATFSGHERGFTLIEMLVVIAIISILIGIGINTFTIAQKKARDVRRKADIRAIQTALELYKQDNGAYPSTGATNTHSNDQAGNPNSAWLSDLAPYLKIPYPPSPVGAYSPPNEWESQDWHVYMYYGSPVNYVMYARLENRDDPQGCGNKDGWQGNAPYGPVVCNGASTGFQYRTLYWVTSPN